VGGHLDSWDVAQGAHDDGTGIAQSMEVLRLFKELGIRPKRTIRIVLFMNEENGNRGGIKYAELAKQNNEKHIFALESDSGGFTPKGFGIQRAAASVLEKSKDINLCLLHTVYTKSSVVAEVSTSTIACTRNSLDWFQTRFSTLFRVSPCFK
jgi:Zn-dependent M28 family amino/carboxypeptidase